MADRKVIWDDKDHLTPNLVLDFGFLIQLLYTVPILDGSCPDIECSSFVQPGEKWNKGAPRSAVNYGFWSLAKGFTSLVNVPLTRHDYGTDKPSSTPEQKEDNPTLETSQ